MRRALRETVLKRVGSKGKPEQQKMELPKQSNVASYGSARFCMGPLSEFSSRRTARAFSRCNVTAKDWKPLLGGVGLPPLRPAATGDSNCAVHWACVSR